MKVQSAEAIGYRALGVWMVCIRANLEAQALCDPQATARNNDLLKSYIAWAEQNGIAAHYSADERDVIHREFGKIPVEEIHAIGMRLQALGGLLWAISRMEMPPYYETIPAAVIQPLMPGGGDPVKEFLRTAQARPEDELRLERRRAEFWNWRCRCDQMRRMGTKPPKGQTYKKTIADAADAALKDGLIAAVVRGDVSCNGVPFGDLDNRAFAFAASSALERHYALNWVCGYATDWDKVPTDT
jgi:uncharacterized protein DUF4272